jgi:hypothetical protein
MTTRERGREWPCRPLSHRLMEGRGRAMTPIETPEVALPTLELPTEDGVPLESSRRRIEINLLI